MMIETLTPAQISAAYCELVGYDPIADYMAAGLTPAEATASARELLAGVLASTPAAQGGAQ